MPGRAAIGFRVEIVAEGPLAGDGVMVGRDIHSAQADPLAVAVHIAIGAEAR